MNNELKTRTLLDRFFDGLTTLDEEQQLYDYFGQPQDSLPADLRPLRQMFVDLAALAVGTEPLPAAEKPRPARRRWVAAAAIAVLVAGGALLFFRESVPAAPADEELVAYVYGLRVTDPDQVLSEMHRTMTAMTVPDGTDEVEEQLKAMFND